MGHFHHSQSISEAEKEVSRTVSFVIVIVGPSATGLTSSVAACTKKLLSPSSRRRRYERLTCITETFSTIGIVEIIGGPILILTA